MSTYTDASSVDGDYNSARLLPEMTHYGSAQLTNAKFYGSAGMASLRAMLEHANRYGLKIHIRPRSLLRATLDIRRLAQDRELRQRRHHAWSKDDVPPAHRIDSDAVPSAWMGLMWGTLPVGVSIFAIFLVLLLPSRRRSRRVSESPLSVKEELEETHYVA